jgi:hypothetical protein
MIPQNTYIMEELEFNREIKKLNKKDFLEFRKRFREFSSEMLHRSPLMKNQENNDPEKESIGQKQKIDSKAEFKENLRLISRKLHLIKKEYERREAADVIHLRIKEMLATPEEMLAIDDPDFKEAVLNMDSKCFSQYVESYQTLYADILQERKKIIKLNGPDVAFDKQNRDNLRVIKRWDLLEYEMSERERKTVSIS